MCIRDRNIPDSAIRTGLEQVSWPGRFELLRHSPAFRLDGSHNAHGMRATVESLRDRFPGQKFVFLISIMADKDVDEMLALLLTLEYPEFYLVNCYTPNSQDGLKRLDYRMTWEAVSYTHLWLLPPGGLAPPDVPARRRVSARRLPECAR